MVWPPRGCRAESARAPGLALAFALAFTGPACVTADAEPTSVAPPASETKDQAPSDGLFTDVLLFVGVKMRCGHSEAPDEQFEYRDCTVEPNSVTTVGTKRRSHIISWCVENDERRSPSSAGHINYTTRHADTHPALTSDARIDVTYKYRGWLDSKLPDHSAKVVRETYSGELLLASLWGHRRSAELFSLAPLEVHCRDAFCDVALHVPGTGESQSDPPRCHAEARLYERQEVTLTCPAEGTAYDIVLHGARPGSTESGRGENYVLHIVRSGPG